MATGVFATAHPEAWSDVAHDSGHLVVLVTHLAALQGPRPGDALAGAVIGALRLVVRT